MIGYDVSYTGYSNQVIPQHSMPALTGCDTTSKISTKRAAMKAIHNNLTLIQNFNNSELTESMIQMA